MERTTLARVKEAAALIKARARGIAREYAAKGVDWAMAQLPLCKCPIAGEAHTDTIHINGRRLTLCRRCSRRVGQ